MKICKAFLLAINLGLSLTSPPTLPAAFAEENSCDSLRNVRDVLDCALENHPDVRQAQIGLEQGKALRGIASQRPNPELTSQDVFGDTKGGGNFTYLEFNLAHTVELGGKRKGRIERARAESDQRGAELLASREEVYIKTLLSLYRIRQLRTDLGLLNDALASFDRIVKQYRSRSVLNPEQEATLGIFEAASSGYQLQKPLLEAELDRENRALEFSLGRPFVPQPGLLPQPKKSWPKLKEESLSDPVAGSRVQSAQAELEIAKAGKKVAQGHSWPDLKIGPTFEHQSQSIAGFNAYGLNFSLPLPIFHANGAGRDFATQEIAKATILNEATEKEARDQRSYYFKRYQGAVRALQSQSSLSDLNKKHAQIEDLFDRGLLPGTLVIEIHRQLLDFAKARDEQELAAVESLASFYALEGRLFEESL